MKRVTVILEVDDREFSNCDNEEEKVECIENMIYSSIEDYGYDIRVGRIQFD